ncbi:MAG: SdrD B-like domain-containing protein [Peptostreptococcaceae bacterium]
MDNYIVEGYVWVDQNVDGIKDSDEVGYYGANVSLYKEEDDSFVKNEITDSEGKYSFDEVEEGRYYLIFSDIGQNNIFLESNGLVSQSGKTESFLVDDNKEISAPIIERIEIFKSLQIQGHLIIPSQKPDIDEMLSQRVSIEILDKYLVETPSSTSCEGQMLSGYKLIVSSRVDVVCEYSSKHSGVHAVSTSFLKSTFLVVPKSYINSQFDTKIIIEQTSQHLVDQRCSFISISALLSALNY